MALSNELREALAKRRQPRSTGADVRKVVTDCDTLMRGTGAHRNYDQNIDSAGEPDRIPVTGDPDDIDDPDDHAESGVTAGYAIAPPPSMPCSWWISMTHGSPNTIVTPEDVRLVFWHIRYRLAAPETTTTAFPALQDAAPAREASSEAQDSGQPGSPAGLPLWNENLDFPATVGALHERIEELFGPPGWTALVMLWHEACGIEAPPKREKHEDRRFWPAATPIDDTTAASPSVPPSIEALRAMSPPPRPDAAIIEPGLLKALPEMPSKVAGFLCHQPRDPPPWVYQESAGERAEREMLEREGAWPGG
jgi:hypothetical protein